MITLMIAICLLFFQGALAGPADATSSVSQTPAPGTTSAVQPSPTEITDDFCEVNICNNNYSHCYVYSATGEQYCAPSCKLNNGGCGAMECVMVVVQCIRDPCPPAVECQQPRTTSSYSIAPTPTPSCPIRGQYYSSGGGCLPVGATCDDPNPPLLCDAFTCVCPDGQVISPDANRCINVAECPVCPARGQTYITGEFCHPHNATCNNPSPGLLCNVSRCECLFGQVLNQETNQCVDAATCVSCPIRGQYYSVGGCHAVDATCDNRNPPFLCDASLCVCPDGQVVSPDGSRCINVTECPDVCGLPPLVGDCDAAIRRYFYNRTSQRCERFIWGGCGGNSNRFTTVEECRAACEPGTTVRPSPTGITDPPCQVNNNCGENLFCYIYPETGEQYCAQSCLLNNGGCGDQQCTMLQVICFRAPCPPIVQCEPLKSSSTGATRTSVRPTATPSIDICRLQPESGLCLAYFPSYFYNSTSRMCEMFVYGGCGGNENRFSTIEDCQAACGRSVNVCELDPETGPCEANFPSFFYNATSQRCERFVYGGCQGNGNRFSTTTECQKACATDICGLQAEPGNCRASIPSYFYNAATGECEMFIYGGCGGNRNRFSDIDSCSRACSASTTPTPVLPKRNVIVITVSFTGDDLEAMVTDFAAELTTVLVNNGYEDAAIRVIDISYDDKDDVVLSVAVYSREDIVDGATIAALINDNRDNFDTSVSGAVVETSDDSGDSDGLSTGALAGIIVGCVVGLIIVLLVVVMALFYISKQSGSTSKTI
ncbi:uncharacterized protein [Dysidea avara]|uniref:uncharacterized protein isoform X2 n=1 Tax=Dysidea avara TaxID=196820 RepID=UPI00331B2C85